MNGSYGEYAKGFADYVGLPRLVFDMSQPIEGLARDGAAVRERVPAHA
jgi:hypothetical protein